MLRAYIREREGGKFLASVRPDGMTFVSERRSALRFDNVEAAWAMANTVPFACDVVVLAD